MVVWVWICCQCNASGMTLSVEDCPECSTTRCVCCQVHKQMRPLHRQAPSGLTSKPVALWAGVPKLTNRSNCLNSFQSRRTLSPRHQYSFSMPHDGPATTQHLHAVQAGNEGSAYQLRLSHDFAAPCKQYTERSSTPYDTEHNLQRAPRKSRP